MVRRHRCGVTDAERRHQESGSAGLQPRRRAAGHGQRRNHHAVAPTAVGRTHMPLFTDRDRASVEALRYDPAALSSFELLKGCLVWTDEHPVGITSDGYSIACDLW